MDDLRLHGLRDDVEANVDLPDFAGVSARGRQLRRRRTIATAAATAVVVSVLAVGIGSTLDLDRSAEPVRQPVPTLDPEAARGVLSDPRAQVDADASAVDGVGHMLAVVAVPRVGSDCRGAGGTALRWSGLAGRTHAWIDRYREVHPLHDGFVVAAVPPSCRTEDPRDADAYLVHRDGTPGALTWGEGAERICADNPSDSRCRFNLARARGVLDRRSPSPRGAELLRSGNPGPRWARSRDGHRMYWSTDGKTWKTHASSLPPGSIVSASASGRWAVLAGRTRVDFTSNGGSTWHSRDLSGALSTIRVADVDWTVTGTGVLLGVTRLVGSGDVLFRSTDASWTRFVQTGVHTSFGLVTPVVRGGIAYVVDEERWAISTDDGATWRRTPRLP
jgi:hypothetical protein